MQTNMLTQFFWDNFDFLRPMLKYILKINLRKSYWLNSNMLHISILIIYFTALYRWLFSWKIQMREAFVAAMAFTLSVFIGKYIFWIYIYYVRTSLMRSYGDLYTTVMGVIWLFYLMCFFFYGACVCHIYKERRDLGVAKWWLFVLFWKSIFTRLFLMLFLASSLNWWSTTGEGSSKNFVTLVAIRSASAFLLICLLISLRYWSSYWLIF